MKESNYPCKNNVACFQFYNKTSLCDVHPKWHKGKRFGYCFHTSLRRKVSLSTHCTSSVRVAEVNIYQLKTKQRYRLKTTRGVLMVSTYPWPKAVFRLEAREGPCARALKSSLFRLLGALGKARELTKSYSDQYPNQGPE